jgi:small-conductance mechanosensitive channel
MEWQRWLAALDVSQRVLARKLAGIGAVAAALTVFSGAFVLPEPKPSVWLRGFGESSVDHDILVWVNDPEAGVGNVRSDILNRVWRLFAANGIGLPFPNATSTSGPCRRTPTRTGWRG